jgi:hypothetical protein
MIKVAMDHGWPNTQAVDMGTVASGQVTFRRISVQNISPTLTYVGLRASSTDPNLILSLNNSTNQFDFADAIILPNLPPGGVAHFWMCLIAPTITDERFSPAQYFGFVYFRATEVIS